jgi:hypothetical protein
MRNSQDGTLPDYRSSLARACQQDGWFTGLGCDGRTVAKSARLSFSYPAFYSLSEPNYRAHWYT